MAGSAVRVRRSWMAGLTAAGLVAGLLAGTATPGVADPHPGLTVEPMPVYGVPLAQAGELVVWGGNDSNQLVLPPALQGVAVSQVAVGTAGVMLAVTAEGRVVGWGGNQALLHQVPAAVAAADVVQVDLDGSFAAAVTRDGRVLTWGPDRGEGVASPLDVPAGLNDVVQVEIAGNTALAVKSDGSVVAWGGNTFGTADVPEGLRAQAVFGQGTAVYALTTDGTVVGWGDAFDTENLPALTQPGNVKALAVCTGNRGASILADDSLVVWGAGWELSGHTVPDIYAAPSLVDIEARSLVGNVSEDLAVIDTDGDLHVAACGYPIDRESPASLDGAPIVQLAIGESDGALFNGAAVVSRMLRAALPKVAGSAAVGAVLTGTPGTFSGTPEAVTGQWLSNGAPIPGATGSTLTVTAAMQGASISYQSTATKAGVAPVSAASAAVAIPLPPAPKPPVPPAPSKVDSSTKVTKVSVAKKGASVAVSGSVKATKPVAGKATVTIAKGKKTITVKAVTVSAKGAVSLTVKKFAQLVAKKLKAKGKKAKTAYRGAYTVTISYAGNAQVKASAGTKKFKAK